MISPKVMVELHQAKLVPTQFTVTKPGEHAWSPAEQRRFWEAIHRFPQGPWTAIAAYVGSKSTRQAMTHAQKLRQKLNRWKRRVRNDAASSSGGCSPRSLANDEEDDELDADELDGDCGVDDRDAVCSVKHEPADPRATHHDNQHHGHQQPYVREYTHHHHPQQQQHVYPQSAHLSSLSPNDVSCAGTGAGDDDAYLDHLLSDIEPMLETVVHFTSAGYATSEGSRLGSDVYAPFAPPMFAHASTSYVLPQPQQPQPQQHSMPIAMPYQHAAAAAANAYMAPIDYRL